MASKRESLETECGYICLSVIKGDLTAEKADVIVCTASKNLDLNRGRASKAMLKAAGDILQTDCKDGYPNGIKYNEVAIVHPGKLPCKRVFFVALPVWGTSQNEQEHLTLLLDRCLSLANDHDMTSMTLPAFGAGLLRYPLEVVTECTINSVCSFSKNNPRSVLKTVTIVVYSKDTETYKAFERALGKNKRSSDDLAVLNHVNHSDLQNNHHIKPGYKRNTSSEDNDIGSIMSGKTNMEDGTCKHIFIMVMTVVPGTDKLPKADVFVNMVSDAQLLDRGALSISLEELAGESVQVEYEEGLYPGDITVTDTHQLSRFKKIYHCFIPKSGKAFTVKKYLQKMVENCLQQACDDGYKSLVFPAVSTKTHQLSPQNFAQLLCHGIRKFEEEMSQSSTISRITLMLDGSQTGSERKNIEQIYKDAVDDSVVEVESKQKEASDTHLYRLEAALKGAMERTDKGPDRGTLDWFKFMYKKEPRTPSYWKVFHSNKTLKEWHMGYDDVRMCLVPVEGLEFVTIDKLVQDTWQSQHVGQGRDSSGLQELNYKNIKVKQIERIENTLLFEKYFQTRQELFRKSIRKGMFKQMEDIEGSNGPILTTKSIDSQTVLTEDVYLEINEHYMFHGTQDAIVGVIAEQGLDSRLAGASTMFGQGVYAAESSTKADQYSDSKDSRSRRNRKMFLIRMCLGKIHIQNCAQGFARPPCISCKQARCTCGANEYSDSVIGDGSWIFREFVVYDRSCVYPEYIITYDRV